MSFDVCTETATNAIKAGASANFQSDETAVPREKSPAKNTTLSDEENALEKLNLPCTNTAKAAAEHTAKAEKKSIRETRHSKNRFPKSLAKTMHRTQPNAEPRKKEERPIERAAEKIIAGTPCSPGRRLSPISPRIREVRTKQSLERARPMRWRTRFHAE